MEEGFTTTQPAAKGPGLNVTTFIIGIVVIGLVGFVGGMQFQKGKGGTATAASTQAGMGQMGGGMGMGAMGSVTAVDSTSITVKDQRASTSATYSITSSTKITNNGTTAAASDIKVGDTVMIQASTSNTKEATQIMLNPTMPTGGPSGAQGTATN